MPEREVIEDDIAAFADDDEDYAIDADGSILFVRNGQDVQCRYEEMPDGRAVVHVDGKEMAYRDFIVRYLAQLDVFAERLVTKRSDKIAFVDGPAVLDSLEEGRRAGTAMSLLESESTRPAGFAARVCFITADAGHGKTALLRQYQHQCAQEFLDGKSPYIFWHVDLQGRQLLRLSEALMGDLGDLRVPGLWMPVLIRLIQLRAIVLAIDGFDELTAEQGSTDALGALAMLVQQLDGKGTIVAASRRAFFDTEEYLKRSSAFRSAMASACEFDHIQLEPWRKEEAIDYLTNCDVDGKRFDNPHDEYAGVLESLGGESQHPMLTRPFLLTHIVNGALRYGVAARDFVKPASDSIGGVKEVIDAFVAREVASKWIMRETNEPYLTIEQHMRLLSDVADEMHRAQKDRLELDVIEMIAAILFDEWNLDQLRRQRIIQMISMHVLLIIPPNGGPHVRSFDHPEFRDYFIAMALKNQIQPLLEGGQVDHLARYLSASQLSDSAARYVRRMIDIDEDRARLLIAALGRAVQAELRPSYLRANVGTLVAAVLNGLKPMGELVCEKGVMFTSIGLEGTELSNIKFDDCVFVNCSLRGVRWSGVEFSGCSMGEVTLDDSSSLASVRLRDCSVESVRIMVGDEEQEREYAPSRIAALIGQYGIETIRERGDGNESKELLDSSRSEFTKLMHRFLRIFNRTTMVNDTVVRTRIRSENQRVFAEVIPMLLNHEIIRSDPWRGRGNHEIWSLVYPIDVLMEAEDGTGDGKLAGFWQAVHAA